MFFYKAVRYAGSVPTDGEIVNEYVERNARLIVVFLVEESSISTDGRCGQTPRFRYAWFGVPHTSY